MASSPRLSTVERRRRLGRRHHLATEAKSGTVADIARDLCGLHATDPATVHLSAWARMAHPDPTAVERELYEDRALVRMLAMRRTLFMEPLELVPIVQAAASDGVAAQIRATYLKAIETAGIADPEGFFSAAEGAALELVRARPGIGGPELTKLDPHLAHRVNPAPGKSYGAEIAITGWVLGVLACQGLIVRGRPRGSLTSSQYGWYERTAWLRREAPPKPPLAAARGELVGRWLAAFGPATLNDIRWWMGWTVAATREALAGVPTAAVELDGGAQALVLAADLEPAPESAPWVALLPALDPTTMGWQERAWYLGDQGAAHFDRNGNAGPTVWVDGAIVGGWAQHGSGAVRWRLLVDVGREAEQAVAAAAAELERLLGPVQVTPRFPTPLQKELSGRG